MISSKEVAHYYSIPVLDLLNEGGITTRIQSDVDNFIPDNLHPNAEGGAILARKD